MPVTEILGVDQDVGESGYGGLMLSVGFEYFGGRLDFVIVARERLLDELYDVVGSGVDELGGIDLHE